MDYVLEFDKFVRSIKQNMDTKFSMFLGAGASVESGVPSAGECIWEWKRDIFISKNPVLAETHNNIKSEQVKRSIQNWLDNQGIYPQLNSEEEYSKYIEAAYKIADDRRKYFQHLIEGKCPSLGYHIIALLAENEIVKSVWTTNFDGLMLKTAHSYGLVPIEGGCKKSCVYGNLNFPDKSSICKILLSILWILWCRRFFLYYSITVVALFIHPVRIFSH